VPYSARDHVLIALAACGPCSRFQLKRELLIQHCDSNPGNVDRNLGFASLELERGGLVEIDRDEPENPTYDLTESGYAFARQVTA